MVFIFAILLSVALARAADISSLSATLQAISANVYPGIEDIGHKIYANPETATNEVFAHDLITSYFTEEEGSLFRVTEHAYGFETAWKLEFEHIPANFQGELPTLAFLCEYDALPAVKHACGHNLIATVGLAAATMTRQALLDFDIPGRVVVYGTFDEEDKAGKNLLLQAGAFNDSNVVYFEAHPTATSAIQPMQARVNAVLAINEETHALAVENAYKELIIIRDIASELPGHSSTASTVQDVGMYTTNVVQTLIELGVSGISIEDLNNTISSVRATDAGFSAQTWTLEEDENGVAISFSGPGGHASQGTEGPLAFSAETFRALEATGANYTYYLPSNTSHTEIGLTVSIRTRYTFELPDVQSFVHAAIDSGIPDSITYDTPYPALEVHRDLGQRFIDLMATDAFADDSWAFSTIAPAATDASFVQNPLLDETSFTLESVSRPVFHPNYGICEPGTRAVCPFNHQPEFNDIADLDYAYIQTEKVARALAHTAVELANDPAFLSSVRSIVT